MRSQPIGAVIGKISFTDRVKPSDGGHELVVHPQATHREVGRRRYPHRLFVSVDSGYFLIHAEKISVLFLYLLLALFADRLGKVEINSVLERPCSVTSVNPLFSRARRNVAGRQVAE